jgi:hypothetical protein
MGRIAPRACRPLSINRLQKKIRNNVSFVLHEPAFLRITVRFTVLTDGT